MNRNTEFKSVLLTITIILTVLTGCAVKSEEAVSHAAGKVKIVFGCWGNPGENKRFEEFVADFNRKNPGIEAELEEIPSDGYSEKIFVKAASGTLPDVFYVPDVHLKKLVKDNKIQELTNYIAGSKEVKIENYYTGLFGPAMDGSRIWALVPDFSPVVVYYNIDMIRAAGEKTPQEYYDAGRWNWDAMGSIARNVKKRLSRYGLVSTTNSWAPAYSMILGAGGNGTYFNAKGTRIDLDNPEKLAGLVFFSKLASESAFIPEDALPKGQGAEAMFVSGRTAMVPLGRWAVPQFKQIQEFEWDIVPLPRTNSGKDVSAGLGMAYMCMNADSKYKEEAFRFLEVFCGKYGQEFRIKDGGNSVASMKDDELDKLVEEYDVPKHSRYFIQARNSGQSVPLGACISTEANQTCLDTLLQLWTGKIDLETCIVRATTKGNAELANANSRDILIH